MIKKKGYIVLLFIIFLCSSRVFSQEIPYARAVLDTNAIVIGKQVKMHLEVTAKNNERVYWADIPAQIIPGVEVISRSPIDSIREDQKNILRQTLSITSFDTGFYALPPFRFSYYNEGDTTTYFTQTPSVWLEVGTVAVDTSQAFYDIKPLIKAPVTFRELLPLLLILLGAGALVALIIYLFLRKKNSKPVFQIIPPKPKIPPHITALEQLDRLRREKLWQANKVKEYYSKLTDILRIYIEAQFGVPAVEMTTDEILDGLGKNRINDQIMGKLSQLLQTADLVKFAKADPSPLENDTVLNHGVDFVQETKLQHGDETKQRTEPDSPQNPENANRSIEMPLSDEKESQNVKQ